MKVQLYVYIQRSRSQLNLMEHEFHDITFPSLCTKNKKRVPLHIYIYKHTLRKRKWEYILFLNTNFLWNLVENLNFLHCNNILNIHSPHTHTLQTLTVLHFTYVVQTFHRHYIHSTDIDSINIHIVGGIISRKAISRKIFIHWYIYS